MGNGDDRCHITDKGGEADGIDAEAIALFSTLSTADQKQIISLLQALASQRYIALKKSCHMFPLCYSMPFLLNCTVFGLFFCFYLRIFIVMGILYCNSLKLSYNNHANRAAVRLADGAFIGKPYHFLIPVRV